MTVRARRRTRTADIGPFVFEVERSERGRYRFHVIDLDRGWQLIAYYTPRLSKRDSAA